MHFAEKLEANPVLKRSVRIASLYLALFFVVAAVSQLFAFEEYDSIIASYGLPISEALHAPLAALIVVLEVLAIPFLLTMKLSYLMRFVSIVAGWLILLFWLAIGVWQSLVTFYIPNAGLFGAKINLPQGWWLVFYIAALITITVYVSYMLWPVRRHAKSLAKSHQ